MRPHYRPMGSSEASVVAVADGVGGSVLVGAALVANVTGVVGAALVVVGTGVGLGLVVRTVGRMVRGGALVVAVGGATTTAQFQHDPEPAYSGSSDQPSSHPATGAAAHSSPMTAWCQRIKAGSRQRSAQPRSGDR